MKRVWRFLVISVNGEFNGFWALEGPKQGKWPNSAIFLRKVPKSGHFSNSKYHEPQKNRFDPIRELGT